LAHWQLAHWQLAEPQLAQSQLVHSQLSHLQVAQPQSDGSVVADDDIAAWVWLAEEVIQGSVVVV
jgi:hypothetical protein